MYMYKRKKYRDICRMYGYFVHMYLYIDNMYTYKTERNRSGGSKTLRDYIRPFLLLSSSAARRSSSKYISNPLSLIGTRSFFWRLRLYVDSLIVTSSMTSCFVHFLRHSTF